VPATGGADSLGSLVQVSNATVEQPLYHKDLLPVVYVTGDVAGRVDSPLYGMFGMRGAIGRSWRRIGVLSRSTLSNQPRRSYRGYSLKWTGSGRSHTRPFRDMGAAYAVGLILIYLLVVAQFGSYVTAAHHHGHRFRLTIIV